MDIIPFEGGNLPAYLKKANVEELNNDLLAHAGGGFPLISIKGKVFAVVRNGERNIIPNPKDPEAPATLFARPKRIRWISPRFIEWVKTQPCACCGQPADDAHHLIGWGQGGMATKAHDIFTIPLCRVHHRQLHDNPAAFEREYAPQPVLIIQLLDRAYALGVLA